MTNEKQLYVEYGTFPLSEMSDYKWCKLYT